MANESVVFGSMTLGVVIGLIVLLYGVSLNAGQSLNAVMIAGGVISLVPVGVMAFVISRLDHADH